MLVAEHEPNNDSKAPNAINVGDTVTGALSASTDIDYFALVIASPGVYQLDFSSQAPSGQWSYTAKVYDAQLNLLSGGGVGFEFGASQSFAAVSPGTYYVRITSNKGFWGGPYSFSLNAAPRALGDFESGANRTIAGADALALDHPIAGELPSGPAASSSFFKVTSDKGGLLSVQFTPAVQAAFATFTLKLYDASGRLLTSEGTGASATISARTDPQTTYYVEVKSAGFDDGVFTVKAHEESLSALDRVPSPSGASIAATLTAGVSDWYQVYLAAGSLVELKVAGAASGKGTLADPALAIFSSSLETLESRDNLPVFTTKAGTQADPQIGFIAPVTGTYYLRVDGKGGAGSYVISQSVDDLATLVNAELFLQSDAAMRWNYRSPLGTGVSLTYSFLDAPADGAVGFVAMTSSQREAVRKVLALYSSVANISFTEVSTADAGQLRFGTADLRGDSGGSNGITHFHYGPDGMLAHNDVFLTLGVDNFAAGAYGLTTLIHEVGHALGLKHPGNYSGNSGAGALPFIPPAFDNGKFAVMSYVDDPDSAAFLSTPGLIDIAAVQSLYGTNASRAGTTLAFSFDPSVQVPLGLISSGATIVIDLSNQAVASTVYLTPGSFSSIGKAPDGSVANDNVFIPFGATARQVIASGWGDFIYGSAGDDSIVGFNGAQRVDGGGGTNTLVLTGTAASLNAASDAQLVHIQVVDATRAGASANLDLSAQLEALKIFSPPGGSIVGGRGDDIVVGFGAGQTVDGGPGRNTLALPGTAPGLNAAQDADLKNIQAVDLSSAASTVVLDLHAQHDVIDVVCGTFDVRITCSSAGGVVSVGAGNATIQGSAAMDTLAIAANRATYNIQRVADGYTLAERVQQSHVHTIAQMERVRFSDLSVNLLIGQDSRKIAAGDLKSLEELYVAFLNREPDADGLDFWINQHAAGQSLRSIADTFWDAALHYPTETGYRANMSNSDFVRLIYQNVLGRSGKTAPPDADVGFWANRLASGADSKGSLVITMLASAHSFKGDASLGWVADLLDNKATVADWLAVRQGVTYNSPSESITKGMAVAAAVTATDTAAAIALVGINDLAFTLA